MHPNQSCALLIHYHPIQSIKVRANTMQRFLFILLLGFSISCSTSYLEQGKASGFELPIAKQIDASLRANENGWCFRKGGVGTLGHGTYVVTRSNRNEVILPGGTTWKGRYRWFRQMVVVSGGRIIRPGHSQNVELKECVVISFRRDRIIYYDFEHKEGGAYERD